MIIFESEKLDRGGNDDNYPRFTEQQFIDMVDGILENQDKNKDGYVDYFEFQAAQKQRTSPETPQQ